MKALLFILFSFLFYVSAAQAQPPDYKAYEYMYKKQPASDTVVNNNAFQPLPIADTTSLDTSKVIGFATATLYKKQPESPLGNLMADCMKVYAERRYEQPVDAAFVNFGSIRYYIPKGDITIGTILKVMPYNNKVALLSIKGLLLKQFLDHQANLGGWPCAGISMVIKNKTADSIIINNQPLDITKTYTIAVTDYIANGGNQCTMLKNIPQVNKNYLFRTALIDYIVSFTQAGKPVTAATSSRIVYRNE